jgi:hypothetical protein
VSLQWLAAWLAYGTGLADAYRQAAIYTGRLLRDDKPACRAASQVVTIE